MIMTTDQVKAKFHREGRTFAGFAREHGFSEIEVYKLLNGQTKGLRGKAHDIAVALGLKAKPESQS